MPFQRAWEPDAWQSFAFQLIQQRHQPQNVQIVPDHVRGDAGLECFSVDGCLYQCYAPQEVADVAKAASAMKEKARRDLDKLDKNRDVLGRILQTAKGQRWILLCPFLDDKEVVAAVRARGLVIRNKSLPFLAPDFEALVQSQADFAGELEHLRRQSRGLPIRIDAPSDAEVAARAKDEITKRVLEKLSRAFPRAPQPELERLVKSHVRANLVCENALHAMRIDHAVLWERSLRCLTAEEARLTTIGAGPGAPSQQLAESVTRIEQSLRVDLPDLTQSTITQIATGAISDWLIRCPLDFPEAEQQ